MTDYPAPWEDPRVAVIVDHWESDPQHGDPDPSWPSVASGTLRALEAAGYRIVHPERMAEDCEDPWVCCIHERPTDG